MSAAIASRRRPSRIASAIYGSSSTSNTRTLRCYELAHIVGISKTAYVLATPRCLDWWHDLQRTSTNSSPPYPIDRARRRLRVCGMTKTLQPHYGTTTRYGPRRRRVLLGAALALLLAATAFA